MRWATLGFIAIAGLMGHPAWGTSKKSDPFVCHPVSSKPKEACNRFVNDPGESAANRAQAYAYRALRWDWGKKDGLDRALADYTSAIRLDPAKVDYRIGCASAMASRDFNRALADYEAALRISPDNARVYAERGLSWAIKLDYDRAIADFDEALRHAPPDYVEIIKINRDAAAAAMPKPVAPLPAASPAPSSAPSPPQPATVSRPDSQTPPASALRDLSAGAGEETNTDCSRAETHWKVADDIKSVKAYEDHIARFPSCEFADLARMRIEALKK